MAETVKNAENPRRTAVKLLCRVEEGNAFSNLLLDEHFSRSRMDQRDKSFCTALFYGTLERKLTLDEIIKGYITRPGDRISSEVRNILRTAIYQLLYMDSVPESAAVNEAVKLASKNRNPAVKGFVNGVLRQYIRDGKGIPLGADIADRLSLMYSCPKQLVEKWIGELGREKTEQLLADSLGRPPVTIRTNTTRVTPEALAERLAAAGLTVHKNKYVGEALGISGVSPESTSEYAEGLFHVQDVSCMLCCRALDPKPGMTVLDMCAAPGGKTFTVAEMMGNEGRVLAFDLHKKRAGLIAEGAKRLGLTIIEADGNDAKVYRKDLPQADRVLCDVPCSGLGVIRRKPEIKYKDLAEFDRLPEIQYEILDTCSRYVKAGGVLVYSTCTVSEAENAGVVLKFLKEHTDFELSSFGEGFGQFSGEDMLTVLPCYFGSDGFFIAKLTRKG